MTHKTQADSGFDRSLSVSQNGSDDSNVREQVRVWLRTGYGDSNSLEADYDADSCSGSAASRPWLMHDWRGVGDEDSSAVVTFGTF